MPNFADGSVLQAQRKVAHEAGIVALGQPIGFGSDAAQHIGQLILLVLLACYGLLLWWLRRPRWA